MTVEVTTRGLEGLQQFFRTAEEAATTAAAFAVNDTALFARRLSSKEIRDQVNFPARYLTDPTRLGIVKKAHGTDLEAIVRGRDRPTSLARFATGSKSVGRRGVSPRVRVSAGGGSEVVKKGFFIRLRRGNADVGEGAANIGLAVRLKSGERVRGKHSMVGIGKGLYLLYGPSVGQVFRSVAVDVEPQVSDRLAEDFLRHFKRITNVR